MPAHEPWQLTGSAAESYERYPGRYILGPWTPALVTRAGLKPGECVLDVACGTGSVARLAAAAVSATGVVTGLDLNASMLAVARSLPAPAGASITWIEGSATAMKLADASFDVVFCQQGLQFFPDRLAATREMHCVLVTSGRVLVSVWRAIGPYHAAVIDALTRHVGAEVATRFSTSRTVPNADELERLFVEAGFQTIAVQASRMNVRLPAVHRFVLSHLASTPVAAAVAALEADARAALADEVRVALRGYLDGEDALIPDETNVITALA